MSISSKKKYQDLDIYFGKEGMNDISNLLDYDITVFTLVEISGLEPIYPMIKNGKTVAYALNYSKRLKNNIKKLNLVEIK